ncbi:MAG: Nramp family divalent metal transporter [Williamsia sp.]|nr:Nramp family divalent metal transporter [Williamsia sp.]
MENKARGEEPVASQQVVDEQDKKGKKKSVVRELGLGLITGAADDDPSAIGTYASAGAKFGPSFLWMAPAMYPMMFAVVYLSSKLGQVSGKGLFDVIRDHYPRWILTVALVGVMIGNTIEAAADIGGIAAALNTLMPVPTKWIAVGVAVTILAFQVFGSYRLIKKIFRWLALTLLTYVASALLAKPNPLETLKGTFIPHIRFNHEFLSLVVAIIGTSLSAYLFTWQSNQEVEEEIAKGRHRVWQRRGASIGELKESRKDILYGMFFATLITYFIILSTASTLFKAGKTDISSAAEAAEALRPVAGNAAGILFALGIVGVGFLAVPVMTIGAAYDFCQAVGWKQSLHAKPSEAKRFYVVIAIITGVATAMNFLGINPMKALVFAGIVQGFSTPPLMLLIMLMTNNKKIMGEHVNSRRLNILGWVTTGAIFLASITLIVTWIL